MTCPSCGADAPAGARFCPTCGSPLLLAADERRVVTVLFADIVGFTTLSESRDPEQVKNLVDRTFARLTEDVRAFGGTLDKIVGDALVALFGAPVAHEDDAERAVRCALRMHETLRALDAAVRMRIGINTGEVLVGGIRAGGDYTAMGDVVNTASRLQTMAEPGTVVVGPDTHEATKQAIRYEPLGLVQPRGREGAVEAWVAVEALAHPGRRLRPRRSPRLVGRDDEFAVLEHALERAISSRRPTLALLLGEAGVGKSRLAEEVLLRLVAQRRVRVLAGRAVPYGAANAWWPIAEVMRDACGIGPDDADDEARAKAVATVADLFGTDPSAGETVRTAEALLYLAGVACSLAEIESDRAQDEVSRAVRTFIERLADRQPLIVTLGDMQWADVSVLAGLDDMLHRLHRAPIAIVLTARPDLLDTWTPRVGGANLVALNLDPLDTGAAEELLVALLGTDPGPAVRAELVDRSGGNPLFVEELAALVSEETDVDHLPATLRGIVAARLDALPPSERAVLADAAVIGRRAPLTAVHALGGSRGGVQEALDGLTARDLLAIEGGQFEFRSDLVREVVYGMLTKAERARRHALFAQWLDTYRDDPTDELLGERARHWATAAELDTELGGVEGVPPDVRGRAIAALEEALARAEDRELQGVALRWSERLLDLIGDEASPARRRALVARARAATALRMDDALADLDAVEAEARAADDDGVLGAALVVRGDALRNHGDYDAALRTLQEARLILQRTGDRRGEGAALRRIGWTLVFAGDLERAEPVLHAALQAFEDAGARRGQGWAHQNLAWIAFARGDTARVERELDQSEAIFRQIGDWGGLNWALGMRGWVALSQGRMDEAEASAERAMVDAEEHGDVWQLGMTSVLLASVRLWQGRSEDAVALAGAARDRFRSIDDLWGVVQASGPLARGLLLCGRIDEAAAVRADLLATVEAPNGPVRQRPLAVLAEAVAAAAVGDGARALDVLDGQDTAIEQQRLGTIDGVVARVLALLQVGRPADALAAIEAAPATDSRALRALALAASGRTTEARREAPAEGGYADRAIGAMATACAAAADGDAVSCRDAADALMRIVDATQDRLTAAIAALARARALATVDDPFAGGADADARSRLDAIGIDGGDWNTVFEAATSRTLSR